MRFNIVDNQHWCSKCHSSARHSNLAVTLALGDPLCPRTVRVEDNAVGYGCFDEIWRFSTQFADVKAPIAFHRLGDERFHLFNQAEVYRPFRERMNVIQPAHMNHARMQTTSIRIWEKIREIRHGPTEIIKLEVRASDQDCVRQIPVPR